MSREPNFYIEGGKEFDREGKQHIIQRVRCVDCDAATSEMHYGCCGFASNGWQSSKPHECKAEA